jgi:hypothetical protein
VNCIRVPGAPSHTGIGNFPQPRPWNVARANDKQNYAFDSLPNNCSLLTSFLPWLSPIISAYQPCPALEEVTEDFTELMQRLLEIQSGGRQRGPQPIEEDERFNGWSTEEKLGRKAHTNGEA